MKIRVLLFAIGLASMIASCGAEDLGKSDCAIHYINYLDRSEDEYQELMVQPDSQGNDQSLENCYNRHHYTRRYILRLYTTRNDLNAGNCTEEEKNDIRAEISERIQELEQDIENIWSRCDEVFGGD